MKSVHRGQILCTASVPGQCWIVLVAGVFAAAFLLVDAEPGAPAGGNEPVVVPQNQTTKSRRHRPPTPSAAQLQKDVEEAEEADDGPAIPAQNGEYETVKLADGSEVQVEKWGETFDAYDYRPSVTLDDPKAEEILWFRNLGRGGINGGLDGMQVDSEAGKLYWVLVLRTTGRIGRCNLDGSHVEFLVKDLRHPHELVLDLKHRRMYWLQGAREKHALMTAQMSGKEAKPLVEGLNRPAGLALDVERGELYYWEKPGQIVRVKTDGTGEGLFLDKRREHYLNAFVRGLSWNPKEDKLYWLNAGRHVRRAGHDATNVEEVFDTKISSGYGHIAFDFEHHQSVFPFTQYGQLIRENLDGSGREVLATSPPQNETGSPKAVAFDAAIDGRLQMVYWTAGHFDGTCPFLRSFG